MGQASFTELINSVITLSMSVVFKNGFAEGFAFAIPEAFSDALKQEDTVKPERFKIGDTFYESPEGYECEWGKYLKTSGRIIQVSGYKNSDLVIKIFRANKNKTALEEIESREVSSEQLLKILKTGL
jgi:hypothetical protein